MSQGDRTAKSVARDQLPAHVQFSLQCIHAWIASCLMEMLRIAMANPVSHRVSPASTCHSSMTLIPQVNVHKYGPDGGVDLIRAFSTIYNETRAFLIHNYDITEDVVCFPAFQSAELYGGWIMASD